MLVTCDTQIMIWGVRRDASEHDKHRLKEASDLIDRLDKLEHEIALTTVVFGEYLVRVGDSNRSDVEKQLLTDYRILPYDAKAAAIAADLRRDKAFLEQLKQYPGATRNVIAADIQLVAAAKAHGVKAVVAHDKRTRVVAARAGLLAWDITGPPSQQSDESSQGVMDFLK